MKKLNLALVVVFGFWIILEALGLVTYLVEPSHFVFGGDGSGWGYSSAGAYLAKCSGLLLLSVIGAACCGIGRAKPWAFPLGLGLLAILFIGARL